MVAPFEVPDPHGTAPTTFAEDELVVATAVGRFTAVLARPERRDVRVPHLVVHTRLRALDQGGSRG